MTPHQKGTTVKRLTVVMFALIGVIAALLLSTSPAIGMGKVKCDASGSPTVAVANFDPIVNHNGTGSMHEHQFFGNTAWLSLPNPDAANYTDLEGKATNCRNVLGQTPSVDTAGYWQPTLRYISGPNAGKLIPAQQFTAYYRSASGAQFGPAQPIPADARLIGTNYSWSCGQFSGIGPVSYIPSCVGQSGKPGHTLTAKVTFPSCWDGVKPNHTAAETGDTRDNAHFAYRVGKRCPAGFPIGVTELRETVQFPYVGNGTDVGLSSDMMAHTTGGRSLHGDFWQAWVPSAFSTFVQDCVVSKSSYSSKACQP